MKRLRLLFSILCLTVSAMAQDSLPMAMLPDTSSAVHSLTADTLSTDGLSADSLSVDVLADTPAAVCPDTLTTDSTTFPRVSLLTCSPGVEIWQQYGHTAIRYEDPAEQIDVVFNYGLFSFATPHFVWRFCTGQTDYIVGVEDYAYFELEYMERGSSVTMQVLDMAPDEVERFWNLITTNCRKENRTYRYNFFYKNCATMARDILYRSFNEPVTFAASDTVPLRAILHECNGTYPWASFAIDLVLGAEADRPVTHDIQEFAPDRLCRTFAAASAGGTPLVKETQTIGPVTSLPDVLRFPLSPMQAMIVLLIITAIVCVLELLLEKLLWIYDILLYGLQGLMGLVIAFLFFCSGHPAVDSNVLVIFFNPLAWVFLYFILRAARRHTSQWACWAEMALAVALVAVELCVQQQIPPALWVLVASLLLRSLHHLFLHSYLLRCQQRASHSKAAHTKAS